MTVPGGGFVLAVDLGTSHTVAMLRWPDGRVRPLLFDGQPLLPSAVYRDAERRLHVGRDAQRLGYADPARIEPNPKRRIDDDEVLLGDAGVPVADLLAALLGAVAREAVATAGLLPPAVLTYPAAWGQRRRDVLISALGRAGWPVGTELVAEPVAAARYFADVLRRPVPVGSALAVFDFGGGTLDVAVVRNEGLGADGRPRFAVAASGGADDLGGLDLDATLVEHLGKSLAGSEPEAWGALTDPRTLAQWRARRQFWEDVRGAKEMLSRSAVAPVPVPGVEEAVHLTREELEAAAGPLIRRGVAEAGAVIKAAGLVPSDLAGLFLVGGSSRVPLVARLLHAELGVAPTVLEQPELPVAEGALAATRASSGGASAGGASAAGVETAGDRGEWTGAAAAADVGHGELQYRRGVAEAATPTPTPATVPQQQQPRPAEPAPEYGEAVDPWATGEVAAFGPGGPPAYPGGTGAIKADDRAAPGGGRHEPTSGAPAQEAWLASTHKDFPGAKPGAEPAVEADGRVGSVPPYRKKWVLGLAAALVVVVGAGVALAVVFWPGYRAIDFQPFDRSTPVSLAAAGQFSSNFADTKIVGDRIYYATEADDGTLGVVAADAGTGKELWRSTAAGVATGWDRMVALPDGLAAFTEVDSGSDQRRIAVLDADRGRLRWQRTLAREDAVVFSADLAVLSDAGGKRLVGLRRSDGSVKWEKPNPTIETGTTTALFAATTSADVGGPAAANGLAFGPDRDDDNRLLQVMYDRSARVLDAATGDVLVEPKPGIASPDGAVVVHNGRVVVIEKSTSTQRVLAYDLETLGTPRSIGQIGEDQQVTRIAPCGDDHVCWVETTSFSADTNQVAGVNVADGGKIWRVPLAGADSIVPVGDNVLASQTTPPTARTSLIDAATGKVRWSVDGAGARVDGGNVLVFSRALSISADDPSLSGRPVGDNSVQLGPLSGVRSASCSWNTEVIACIADKDLRWQRFAS